MSTSEFAQGLLDSATEAAAHMRGEQTSVVVHHFPDPRAIRMKLGRSQEDMARLLGMSLSGYRKLEQGQRSVSGPVRVLLRILESDPTVVERVSA